MPNYDYHCTNCHKKLEVTQKISDAPLKDCPECHQASLRRGPGGGIGFQLKGAGFYKNDYASNKLASSSAEPAHSCKATGCCPCS